MNTDATAVESHVENRRVLRSAGIVSAGTGFSRILGFVREMLMAYFFASSTVILSNGFSFACPKLRSTFSTVVEIINKSTLSLLASNADA